MTIKRTLLALSAPIALLALSGCAEGLTANVARFQRLPVPQGQSFSIQPSDPMKRGSLEFAQYASQVSADLAHLGYRPVAGGAPADMIVQMDYGVDHGQQRVTTSPGFDCGWGGGPWGGYGGFGRGWGWGWGGGFGGWGGYGGFGGGGFGCPDVESYSVYTSFLTMKITRADGARLFEGRARAHSGTDNLTHLVPALVQAMFTGFPGNSGQDLRITIPPPKRG